MHNTSKDTCDSIYKPVPLRKLNDIQAEPNRTNGIFCTFRSHFKRKLKYTKVPEKSKRPLLVQFKEKEVKAKLLKKNKETER